MENYITYLLFIFGLFMYAIAEFSFRKQKAAVQLNVDKHNRKVLLGVREADWDAEIEEDCFHDSSFFYLENSGTYDTSYIANHPYHQIIDTDDLFLED